MPSPGLRFSPDPDTPKAHVRICPNKPPASEILEHMAEVSGVVTTGIYCRPGCSARPKPENVRQFAFAAAAEAFGYRPCLRCRPYRSSPTLAWATGPELVCRAVHMIIDGALDERGEGELAGSLGVSGRQLRRLFASHVGTTPDRLARSCRAHFARRLLDDTELSVTQIAFASGFGSVRQLNRTCREVFSAPPRELRARRRHADRLVADGGLLLRLPFTGPLDWEAMLSYFHARAIPGVERVTDDSYRRTVVVEGDPGVLELAPGARDELILRAHLPHWEGLIHVVQRARRIFSLDSPVNQAIERLSADPVIGPLVTARPGLRVPGTWDAYETGVRAIIGQQISVSAANTIIGRLVRQFGRPVAGLDELGLSHSFPPPEVLGGADLSTIGLPRTRASATSAFARAVDRGEVRLDRSATLDELLTAIGAITGLGPWTAQYIALRLGERDAFPADDLGIRRALQHLSANAARSPGELAAGWAPWRATAAVHLWHAAPRLARSA
jgi:AraC family transcriptional regulator of adaptative response / DNA-3-methyladenine glycosylase II